MKTKYFTTAGNRAKSLSKKQFENLESQSDQAKAQVENHGKFQVLTWFADQAGC